MFWAKEEEESSLMQLLRSENFTLEDVLLNEFVVQDSRYGKPELVQYITKQENMVALLNLSLNPTVNPNLPLKEQYRLSFIASEILTIRGTDVFQELIVTTDDTKQVLIDFLRDTRPLSHLIAGFFAKIMECLLSRKFLLTFELLQNTPFFDKCLQNINLGAIECLLENLVRIPNTSDGTRTVKEWMMAENLFEKIVDRITESSSDDDNECLSEVYCEIVRELRDKLYMVENKEDELHDKAMDETLVSRLAENLIVPENCTAEELVKKSATIAASAKILEAFIKTNFVPDAPAQHLEELERNLLEERHYLYGLMRPCIDNDNYEQSYQPDPERIVEGIVANRLPNIFQTIYKSITTNGSVWQPLLRLVIELCNTNNLATHEKLANAMQNLPFVKLIDAAKNLPRASVLHSLLVKVVVLLLHSTFPLSRETFSPAAEYLLTDGDLVKNIYDTACSFHTATDLIACSGLRSFNQNLGDAVLRAKRSNMVHPKVASILQNDERWPELEDIVLSYNSKNRPQVHRDFNNDSSIFSSSLRNDSHGFNDSEEWTDASAKFAELDASSHNRNLGNLGFEANLQRFSELEGQFDDTPDEDEFKKLCSERANSSSCSGARATPDSNPYSWPGEDEKEGEKTQPETKATPNPDEVDPDEVDPDEVDPDEVDPDDEWVWPTTPPLGETEVVTMTGPRPDNIWVDKTLPDLSHLAMPPPKPDEMWADFSSFSSVNPITSNAGPGTSEFTWPGASSSPEQGESSDWPLNSSHDSKPSDPATVGLAASISHPKDDSSDA